MSACEVCGRSVPTTGIVGMFHRVDESVFRCMVDDPDCYRLGYERLRESAPEQQAKIEALAEALEAVLGWQSLAPDDEIERARAALRAVGRP